MPGKAPVDQVGGSQNEGPWPEHVEEIVQGETYERPVKVLTEIRCTEHDTTFPDMPSARDHVEAEHGGDDSVIETTEGVETRQATVHQITRLSPPDVPDEEAGYSVTIEYDRTPGGGSS